ncbi:MAG TPA: hypothetical protein PLK06_04325 [bacterium]|nr:hypothetical protein [bacterium]
MSPFSKPIGLLGLILAIHFIAIVSGWYAGHLWFDIPMHFSGGFAIGMLALAFRDALIDSVVFKNSIPVFWQSVVHLMGIVGVVAIVGIAWEWYEFLFDSWVTAMSLGLRPAQMGLGDTMADLFLDLLGAGVAFFVLRKHTSK